MKRLADMSQLLPKLDRSGASAARLGPCSNIWKQWIQRREEDCQLLPTDLILPIT